MRNMVYLLSALCSDVCNTNGCDLNWTSPVLAKGKFSARANGLRGRRLRGKSEMASPCWRHWHRHAYALVMFILKCYPAEPPTATESTT
jgi:hypothetical protein